MEVLSFITQNPDLINKFGHFIKSYDRILLNNKDSDTEYFINPNTEQNEIYFHFVSSDFEKEFSYNYSDEDKIIIIDYFGNSALRYFDIQFRNEKFLQQLLIDFKKYLRDQTQGEIEKILISHPYKGMIVF